MVLSVSLQCDASLFVFGKKGVRSRWTPSKAGSEMKDGSRKRWESWEFSEQFARRWLFFCFFFFLKVSFWINNAEFEARNFLTELGAWRIGDRFLHMSLRPLKKHLEDEATCSVWQCRCTASSAEVTSSLPWVILQSWENWALARSTTGFRRFR